MTLKESDIKRQIRDYLNYKNIFHWNQWQGPMSQPKGVSDIIGCYKGRFFAIEVKRPGGKLTDYQFKFLEEVANAGGIAIVAFRLEDVQKGMMI